MLRTLSVVAAAAFILSLLQSMPPPYENRIARDIDPSLQELMPGNKRGSKLPADFSTGPFRKNERLKDARRLFQGRVLGSESVAVSQSGELVMLDKFGYVRRAKRKPDGDALSYELSEDPPLYIGPGRPLGFHLFENGNALLVCDSLKGLLRVGLDDGEIKVVANRITGSGEPLTYVNDLDIAEDGKVYFTSSMVESVVRHPTGFYDTMRSYTLGLLAGDNTGRLLVWDPLRDTVKILMDHLYFPNGVAMGPNGEYVLVVETNTCRILRYWIRGKKKGKHDVFIDKLPGFPDGLTRSKFGGYWVSLVAPLNPLMKYVAPYPWVRQLLSHVVMQLAPLIVKKWGCVVQLDRQGNVVETLMDSDGSQVSSVSAVTESGGKLFLGSLMGDYVSVLKL